MCEGDPNRKRGIQKRHMKALVMPAIALYCALFLLSSKETLAGEIGIPPPSGSALSGRLFDGLTNTPIAEGYVFALSASRRVVLGCSETVRSGADAGYWQILQLPPDGEVLLVGFHPVVRFNLAMKKVALTPGYHRLGVMFTTAATHTAGPDNAGGLWNILTLLGWIAEEVNATNANQEAIRLVDRLLHFPGECGSLSGPQWLEFFDYTSGRFLQGMRSEFDIASPRENHSYFVFATDDRNDYGSVEGEVEKSSQKPDIVVIYDDLSSTLYVMRREDSGIATDYVECIKSNLKRKYSKAIVDAKRNGDFDSARDLARMYIIDGINSLMQCVVSGRD